VVPISVASTAANMPTKIEISAPLIALDSTSRPRRSPPKASVSARGASVILILAARSSHSAYLGASGSMSDRSTGLASLSTMVASASVPCTSARGPMNVGGALGTPTSFCQPAATRPVAAASTSSRKASTITSDTMPTPSLRRRRQAARQTPGD